jgi:hypothetical protein
MNAETTVPFAETAVVEAARAVVTAVRADTSFIASHDLYHSLLRLCRAIDAMDAETERGNA